MTAQRQTYQVGEGHVQHVLVQGAGEVGVHEQAVEQGLAHYAAHKLEEVQVVGVPGLIVLHDAVGVGLEGGAPLGDWDKEAEVGVEHLPSHHLHTQASSALIALFADGIRDRQAEVTR